MSSGPYVKAMMRCCHIRIVDLPATYKLVGEGYELIRIGEEVSEQVHEVPQKYIVRRVATELHEEVASQILVASLPPRILPRSIATPCPSIARSVPSPAMDSRSADRTWPIGPSPWRRNSKASSSSYTPSFFQAPACIATRRSSRSWTSRDGRTKANRICE